jgi:hypothetical protein
LLDEDEDDDDDDDDNVVDDHIHINNDHNFYDISIMFSNPKRPRIGWHSHGAITIFHLGPPAKSAIPSQYIRPRPTTVPRPSVKTHRPFGRLKWELTKELPACNNVLPSIYP